MDWIILVLLFPTSYNSQCQTGTSQTEDLTEGRLRSFPLALLSHRFTLIPPSNPVPEEML